MQVTRFNHGLCIEFVIGKYRFFFGGGVNFCFENFPRRVDFSIDLKNNQNLFFFQMKACWGEFFEVESPARNFLGRFSPRMDLFGVNFPGGKRVVGETSL